MVTPRSALLTPCMLTPILSATSACLVPDDLLRLARSRASGRGSCGPVSRRQTSRAMWRQRQRVAPFLVLPSAILHKADCRVRSSWDMRALAIPWMARFAWRPPPRSSRWRPALPGDAGNAAVALPEGGLPVHAIYLHVFLLLLVPVLRGLRDFLRFCAMVLTGHSLPALGQAADK